VSTLKALDWTIEEDAFNDTTPLGTKQFTNIIATKDPKASRRVIVAAHFDSKYFPNTDQVCVPPVTSNYFWCKVDINRNFSLSVQQTRPRLVP